MVWKSLSAMRLQALVATEVFESLWRCLFDQPLFGCWRMASRGGWISSEPWHPKQAMLQITCVQRLSSESTSTTCWQLNTHETSGISSESVLWIYLLSLIPSVPLDPQMSEILCNLRLLWATYMWMFMKGSTKGTSISDSNSSKNLPRQTHPIQKNIQNQVLKSSILP